MKKYKFAIWIEAEGDDADEAWGEAVEKLAESIMDSREWREAPQVFARGADEEMPAKALDALALGQEVGIESEEDDDA